VELIKLLLSHGADVTAKHKQGKTALDCAIESGQKEAIDVLRTA
jgi:ankyrin repeat protein